MADSVSIIAGNSSDLSNPRTGQFVGTAVFGSDEMKNALERLKKLVDGEERLAIAVTYSNTQQTAQVVGRTEQMVEGMSAVQQSTSSSVPIPAMCG
jgi:hypothetical protein